MVMERVYRVIIGLLLLLAAFVLFGCKSVQSVEQVHTRDSLILHHIYDTTRITVTDTLRVEASSESEKDSETEIMFGDGGGTYNAQTGEATNVSGVKVASKEKELTQTVMEKRTTIDMQQKTIDEQDARITELESELEEKQNTADIKPKRNGYDRFCSWWFWITAILLLIKVAAWVMEKIPATSPYVMIARKFIPFL